MDFITEGFFLGLGLALAMILIVVVFAAVLLVYLFVGYLRSRKSDRKKNERRTL